VGGVEFDSVGVTVLGCTGEGEGAWEIRENDTSS
jgi:hypothetical protein